jgi:excinuclease ABC subunit A
VIAEADYLLEIGPEAGANGGKLLCAGTPEEVMATPESRIAPFLKPLLSTKKSGRKTGRAR